AGPDNTLTFTLAAAAHAPGLTAAIQLSNWIMQVETDPFSITAGAPYGDSAIIRTNEQSYTAGDPMTVTVVLSDALDNPVTGVTLSEDEVEVQGGNGTYTAQTLKADHRATLQLSVWSSPVQTQEYAITTGAPYAGTSTVLPNDTVYLPGGDMILKLTLKDKLANPVTGLNMHSASVVIPGNAGLELKYWLYGTGHMGNGEYMGEFSLKSSAPSCRVVVTLPGCVDITSADTIEVTDEVDVNSSTMTFPKNRIYTAETNSLEVSLKDKQGNALTGLAGTLNRTTKVRDGISTFKTRQGLKRTVVYREISPGTYHAEYDARLFGTAWGRET
ncbi:hypothetical protein, partial [Enterobacter roggenkampii]|uniref:hypothetical protein n=1 Tax=Enterobacter roggenkampii TaxID=1812935 RepID=UPI002A800639